MKDVYPSGTPFYTINSTPNFDERPQFRMVLLKRNLGKLKRIWDVFFDKWWKKKGIIYSKIDDWPREITFIVTVRKCLVEVFANNEYSGQRQVAHIVVKSSWSCFLFFDISAGRKSGLITFSDHSMNKHLKCQVSLSSFKQWRQQKWNFFKDLIQTLQ